MDIGAEGSIGARVNRDPLDELLRHGLQTDGPVDAAEDPIVGQPLRIFDARIGGDLADGDFQEVRAGLYQIGDLVFEAVKATLMLRPRGRAIDPDLRIGHRPVEDEEEALAGPGGRDIERAAVFALLIRLLLVVAVVVVAEALQLPVGGHADGSPRSTVAAGRAEELPRHRIILALSREVQDLSFVGYSGSDERGQTEDSRLAA